MNTIAFPKNSYRLPWKIATILFMKTIPRFFWLNFSFKKKEIATLPEAIANHAVRVLRLKIGDCITIFDGKNHEFSAKIASITKKTTTVEIQSVDTVSRESPVKITLLQAVLSADKMDFVIQKATELGVFQIQPIFLKRSVLKLSAERLTAREKHWQSVALSACEQCGRNKIPKILCACDFEKAILNLAQNAETADSAKILFLPNANKTLRDFKFPQNATILTGAEGGFDELEIKIALQNGFSPCRLGHRILRAETAPIAALAALNFLNGDF